MVEALGLPVRRAHSDCPRLPQGSGWDLSRCCLSQGPGCVPGHLPPGPRLSALGDSCAFLSAPVMQI